MPTLNMSAAGAKVDIAHTPSKVCLMTQSGHRPGKLPTSPTPFGPPAAAAFTGISDDKRWPNSHTHFLCNGSTSARQSFHGDSAGGPYETKR